MNAILPALLCFVGIISAAAQAETNTAPTATATVAAEKAAYLCQYVLELKKSGEFMEILPQHRREVLRRLGKRLGPLLGKFTTPTLEFAGFTPDLAGNQSLLGEPVRSSNLNNHQQSLFKALKSRSAPFINDRESEIASRSSGISLRFVADPKSWLEPIIRLAEKAERSSNLRSNQLLNLRTGLLPLLETADLIVAAATLSDAGLDFIVRAMGSKDFSLSVTEAYTPEKILSCARFLDERRIMSFGQVHALPSSQTLVQHLKAIPQLGIIENFLKNAGLDLERDILPAQAVDSLVSIDLNPTGDGGLPDIRVMAKLADPTKVAAILPGLAKLCNDLGIYVASQTEVPNGVKLSYFLLPTFALHVTMTEGHVLAATSRANLVSLHQHMQDVISGKHPAYKLPDGVHRYWRIRFKNLNEQIQRFLQSPLLAGKGIPPIPNLSMLEELGDFEMSTRMKPEYMEIRLSLPITESNGTEK